MTLYEAYRYLYENRNSPELKGRFLTAFSYWRKGAGPNEDTQRKHLLQTGFTWKLKNGWYKPGTFIDLKVITISIWYEKWDEYSDMSLSCSMHTHIIGDYYRIHIAGPEADIKKIQKKFGIPKKMK